VRGQELEEEVAPAELADERLARRGALGHLERREAAEVEVGAQPRGGAGGEVVGASS
jgi:hypothetical protein